MPDWQPWKTERWKVVILPKGPLGGGEIKGHKLCSVMTNSNMVMVPRVIEDVAEFIVQEHNRRLDELRIEGGLNADG